MSNKKSQKKAPVSREYKWSSKLEIGKHTFKDRILENCIYVDKTQYIYELMSRDSNCFLSRPAASGNPSSSLPLKNFSAAVKNSLSTAGFMTKSNGKNTPSSTWTSLKSIIKRSDWNKRFTIRWIPWLTNSM